MPLSTLRVEQVSASEYSLDVHLRGAPRETVHVCATKAERIGIGEADAGMTCKAVVFGAAGGWKLVRW